MRLLSLLEVPIQPRTSLSKFGVWGIDPTPGHRATAAMNTAQVQHSNNGKVRDRGHGGGAAGGPPKETIEY